MSSNWHQRVLVELYTELGTIAKNQCLYDFMIASRHVWDEPPKGYQQTILDFTKMTSVS